MEIAAWSWQNIPLAKRPLRLTKKTAAQLLEKACGAAKLTGGKEGPGAYRYHARLGFLSILIENNWAFPDDRYYELQINDESNGKSIVMYFDPDTLERKYEKEQKYYDILRREEREGWVREAGKETAHKLVDQYWESR